MSKTALVAGSFDPITNGHLNIIERASKMYDKVVVLVTANPNKNSLFTAQQRESMIVKVTKHLENVSIDSFTGLLADYVNENNIDVVVRGLRNIDDFTNEMQMAHLNANLYKNGTETVFLMSEPEHTYISSSAVKEIASLGGDIKKLVPKSIIKYVTNMEE